MSTAGQNIANKMHPELVKPEKERFQLLPITNTGRDV
jgi:hypothetical protein